MKQLLFIVIILIGQTLNAAPNSISIDETQWQNIENQIAISSQQAYIKASNTDSIDYFGNDVAIFGDTLVVGGHLEDSNSSGVNGDQLNNAAVNSGAVYIYNRIDGNWVFDSYIKSSNSSTNDWFGYSVAIYQDTMVIGARLEDSNATLVDGDQNNDLASASGAVYVFNRIAGDWMQTAYIKASNTDNSDNFGDSVAIYGNYIAISATGEDSDSTGVDGNQINNDASNSGAVYLYQLISGNWEFIHYIKASNTDIDDEFGSSLALSDGLLVVGAFKEDSIAQGIGGNQNNNSAVNSGAVYVYQLDGGSWVFKEYLKSSNSQSDDSFGKDVAVINNTIVVGSINEDSNATGVNGDESDNSLNASGAVYVFTKAINNTWSQQAYLKASNSGDNDFFGSAVSVGNKVIVVAARGERSSATGINGDENNNSSNKSGAAYVFAFIDNNWQQQTYIKPFNTGAFDYFGLSVSLSNNSVVVGTRDEDGSSTGVNGVDNNLSEQSGAAYVFDNISDFVFENSFE